MPAPSKLAIATGSVTRLLKEEASYHKELEQQEERIKKAELDTEGENADFQMKQEVNDLCGPLSDSRTLTSLQKRALEETKAVFPPLRQRIMAAASQLEQQLVGRFSSFANGG